MVNFNNVEMDFENVSSTESERGMLLFIFAEAVPSKL